MTNIIDWKDPQIVGAVIAACIGILGVIITLIFSRNSSKKSDIKQSQNSFFSFKSKQIQVGRDLKNNSKSKKDSTDKN